MAKVYTSDIQQLFTKARKLFEDRSSIAFGSIKYPDFFQIFTEDIKRQVGIELKADTLYKQFHIKLLSYKNEFVGYSPSYLNAISRYVHKSGYLDNYPLYQGEDTESPPIVRVEKEVETGVYQDPDRVEFPPLNPSFPATSTFPIQIDGFEKVFLKDESQNPTGTHKDRMAWEVYLFLKEERIKALHSNVPQKQFNLSLISSGCAAVAIYEMLSLFRLPFQLNVIVDNAMPMAILSKLETLNPELLRIFPKDLSEQKLDSDKILEYTNNPNGIDLTFGKGALKLKDNYYDWLSYEILNQSPDYCFIPFGSGDLYRNVMQTNSRELIGQQGSKRFFGRKDVLKECNFIGATTFSKVSTMDKLFSPPEYHPGKAYSVLPIIEKGLCGRQSGIYEVDEKYLKRAQEIAVSQNINCEPSGIAGLAMFLQMKEYVPNDKKVLIINTGKLKL